MKYIASTYDSQSGTISESARAAGQKIITFNGILKYEAFPLAQVVKDILELGTRAMSTPVEIEFAVNLNRQSPKLPEFSLLQIRPIAEGNEESDVAVTDDEKGRNIVYSKMVMGNGNISSIQDVVAIKTESFRQADMAQMANELDGLNAILAANPGFMEPNFRKPCYRGDRAKGVPSRTKSRDPFLPEYDQSRLRIHDGQPVVRRRRTSSGSSVFLFHRSRNAALHPLSRSKTIDHQSQRA